MKNIKSQRGQAIILLAFAIIALVGFAALAIDGGRVLSDRRHAQNAADTSAFAAALAKIQQSDYTTAAKTRATSNGYEDGVNATVLVELCSDLAVDDCPGIPTGADRSEYIRVRIISVVKTTFARVIGRDEVKNTVEAIAHASSVNSNPLVKGAALAAYRRDGTPFNGNGGGNLNVYGSGIFSNSSATSGTCTPPTGAMDLGGSVTYHVDTAFAAAGTVCTHGTPNLDGTITTVPQVPTPKFDITAPDFTCGGAPPLPNPANGVYKPGTYSGQVNTPPLGATFAPGNYCFSGNVKFNGGTVTANDVNFRFTNSASFTVGGSTIFNCSNVIVHSDGGSGVKVTGGTNTCNGITFYMSSGNVELEGNANSIFKAPTSGDYKGLLIYLPEGNNSSIKITGTSNSQYTGSIIAISSLVTIKGDSASAGYNVQVLADTINLAGNSDINIHYNPDELYNPPQYPTIELSK